MKEPLYPPLPIYDEKRDGNKFEWILQAAITAREQRESDHRPNGKNSYLERLDIE